MDTKKKLALLFERVVVEADLTKPFPKASNKEKEFFRMSCPGCDIDNEAIVVYHKCDNEWLILLEAGVLWSEPSGVFEIKISDISSVSIDLVTNKKFGFPAINGLSVFSIGKKNGREYHIRAENGSTAEALVAIIKELIRPKRA